MKILKDGGWKNPWSQEMTCTESSCGALLLVEEADLKPVDYGDGYFSTCPICHSVIRINKLPLRIRQVLDARRKVNNSYYD